MNRVNTDDALYRVFNSLTIGAVELTKKSVKAQYKLEQHEETFTFTYEIQYDEDVLDPDKLLHNNLAAMIAVQPALNYALFTQTLAFEGYYDEADKRMIRRVSDILAREIYFNHIYFSFLG